MRTMFFKVKKRQQGLSLMLVLVLLVITVSTSLHFHQRLVTSTSMSGATRNNSESLMLAESAMEMLRGGFLNTLCTAKTHDCNDPGTNDKDRGTSIGGKMKKPAELGDALYKAEINYIFYAGGADQVFPRILQSLANGGAGVTGARCTIAATRAIGPVNCNLDINSMFGSTGTTTYSPLLYTTNANGLLTRVTGSNWQAVLDDADYNDTVAAAWMEATVNADDEDVIDLWVQAVARVGTATSYVQRRAGNYPAPPNPGALGALSSLVEASNIDREDKP